LNDRACLACHKLGEKDGGIAPDLSYEGLIKDETWILDHFTNPRSRMPDSIMPAFRFATDDFKALTPTWEARTKPPRIGADVPRPVRVATARRATARGR
jgi:cbb3-type cytochrome oxidase cytochrome c subunit